MVNLLGFAATFSTERGALDPPRRARALPRQDNRNVAEESHFFLYN